MYLPGHVYSYYVLIVFLYEYSRNIRTQVGVLLLYSFSILGVPYLGPQFTVPLVWTPMHIPVKPQKRDPSKIQEAHKKGAKENPLHPGSLGKLRDTVDDVNPALINICYSTVIPECWLDYGT